MASARFASGSGVAGFASAVMSGLSLASPSSRSAVAGSDTAEPLPVCAYTSARSPCTHAEPENRLMM